MGSRDRTRERDDRRFKQVFVTVSATVVAAAIASVALVFLFGSSRPERAASASAPPQPVSQEGTVVAVSPDSMTARSSNGFARTYAINAQTTAITDRGSRVGRADSAFTVNDQVSIFAVVRDGTAVATTVAGRDVTDLTGPPMDGPASAPLG